VPEAVGIIGIRDVPTETHLTVPTSTAVDSERSRPLALAVASALCMGRCQ
jgi:hypothetical protein